MDLLALLAVLGSFLALALFVRLCGALMEKQP
jgi:hypothetical protein